MQVTFGDSDGKLDTQAGSLPLGWDDASACDKGTGGTTLSGTNAVVCKAGAGTIPRANSACDARRELAASLAVSSGSAALEMPRPEDGKGQQVRMVY